MQTGRAKISARPWRAIHPNTAAPDLSRRRRYGIGWQSASAATAWLSRINGVCNPHGAAQIRRDRSKEVAARLARRDFRRSTELAESYHWEGRR